MRWFLNIPIAILVFVSCSKELHTTKQTAKNSELVETVAKKVFAQFGKETFLVPNELDTLNLTDKELKLLTRKLKCPYVHIIYDDRYPRFFQSDSVVLFTRPGFPLFGKQHNIIVDMRYAKRDSIPVNRNYLKYYKITHGIYYIQEYMPPL